MPDLFSGGPLPRVLMWQLFPFLLPVVFFFFEVLYFSMPDTDCSHLRLPPSPHLPLSDFCSIPVIWPHADSVFFLDPEFTH